MALSAQNLKTNLSNPLVNFLWEVKIANPIGGVGNTETLLLRAQSTSLPGRRVGVIPVAYKQGAPLQFPGKLEYSHTWSCTFIEGEDTAMLRTFYAWAQSILHDVTNAGGLESEIKTDIYLSMLNRKEGAEVLKIKLNGCFVQSINEVPLSYDSKEAVKLQVTFQYDSWNLES